MRMSKEISHKIFIVSITIKLIDGLFQFFGGIFLFFMLPGSVSQVLRTLFRSELIEDRKDIVANYALGLADGLSIKTKSLIAIYLMAHGIINVAIFLSFRQKKLWLYPLAGGILVLLIIYQLYRFTLGHSLLLLFFTIVDMMIVALLRLEYLRYSKHKGRTQ